MPKPNADSHGNGYSDGKRNTDRYRNGDDNSNRYGDPDGNRNGNAAVYPDAQAASDASAAPDSITVTETIKAGTREKKLASSSASRWI